MKSNLTIGILSWKDRKTLQNTLDSYLRAGLLDYPKQIFIFFNEIDDEDIKIAKQYGLSLVGSRTNLGIAGGYKAMLSHVQQPNFLFLENDWYLRHEEIPLLQSQLNSSIELLDSIEVVRLRSRKMPGEPLWTRKFEGNELSRPEHLLDCIHWIENPEEKFPEQIKQISAGWYMASAKNANWTNNPHMVKTEWAREVILPRLNGDIELPLQKWWETTDYKVVQGEGLFIHNRAANLRGIKLALFGQEAFSDTIKRDNDFYESNILDYIRDTYQNHKTIIDAGASLGNHTVYFANYLKYDSIHSFEPLPETFRLLEINTTYPNIKLYNNALSDKIETLEMNVNRGNNGASRIHRHGEIQVSAISIDSLNLKDVTFIKVDVEDSEEFVLRGAMETIKKYHPIILLEDYRRRPWTKILPGYSLERGWRRQHTYLYHWTGKPYLVELYTQTPGRVNYERTLPIVADSVRHLPVKLRTYRGHLHRWDHMPMTLGDSMCIFTDSADVIFQKPFPELDTSKIYVADEGVNFRDNGIWRSLIRRYPQFEPLLPERIYNVGMFACSGNKMKEWCDYLFSVRGQCRRNSNEQLWFNEWIRRPENIDLITEHQDMFATMYANMRTGRAIIKDGKVVNKDGVLFSAVHFNGSMKEVYRKILYNESD